MSQSRCKWSRTENFFRLPHFWNLITPHPCVFWNADAPHQTNQKPLSSTEQKLLEYIDNVQQKNRTHREKGICYILFELDQAYNFRRNMQAYTIVSNSKLKILECHIKAKRREPGYSLALRQIKKVVQRVVSIKLRSYLQRVRRDLVAVKVGVDKLLLL